VKPIRSRTEKTRKGKIDNIEAAGKNRRGWAKDTRNTTDWGVVGGGWGQQYAGKWQKVIQKGEGIEMQ